MIHLPVDNQAMMQQIAVLLVDSFRDNYPEAWPDLQSALEEVRASLLPGRLSRVAVNDRGMVLGWAGGIRQYDGNVWELHPLMVHPQYRYRGIGKALVADLKEQVRQRGALTLWVGTDDEMGMTTLSGVDLYGDVLGHIAHIRNLKGHPYAFYQKVGFVIVGVMPDANGPGKPDIYMAMPVG
ncbi:N-acetyltransferase [Leptolyngbya sp. 'hensonii']|nr:N-acetyltransferase [Leptolyngbya sp. 'hensonii']